MIDQVLKLFVVIDCDILCVSGSDDSDHQRHCDLEVDSDPVVPASGNSTQEDEEEGQR